MLHRKMVTVRLILSCLTLIPGPGSTGLAAGVCSAEPTAADFADVIAPELKDEEG